jgi:hypothetical protein
LEFAKYRWVALALGQKAPRGLRRSGTAGYVEARIARGGNNLIFVTNLMDRLVVFVAEFIYGQIHGIIAKRAKNAFANGARAEKLLALIREIDELLMT